MSTNRSTHGASGTRARHRSHLDAADANTRNDDGGNLASTRPLRVKRWLPERLQTPHFLKANALALGGDLDGHAKDDANRMV